MSSTHCQQIAQHYRPEALARDKDEYLRKIRAYESSLELEIHDR
jgi:hypothetical protein